MSIDNSQTVSINSHNNIPNTHCSQPPAIIPSKMAKWHNLAIASRARPTTTEHQRLTRLTTHLTLRQASDSSTPKDANPTPSAPTEKLPRSKSQASRIASQQIQDLQSPSQLTRQVPRSPSEEPKVREVIRRTPAGPKPNARVANKPTTNTRNGGSSVGGRDGQNVIKRVNFAPREQVKPAAGTADKDSDPTAQGRPQGMTRRIARTKNATRNPRNPFEPDPSQRTARKTTPRAEFSDDLYDPATMTPVEYLQEYHPNAFDTQQDAHLYGALMAKTARIRADAEDADALLAKARDPAEKEKAQKRKTEIDDQVRAALQDLQDAKDTVYPPHEPQPHTLDHFRGSVGDVPIGNAGMGTLVEDNLRHLASQGWEYGWRDPAKLAQRLVDGEFVKFDSFTEKRQVIDLVRSRAAMEGEGGDLKNVRFRTLRGDARRCVVERLAGGAVVEGSGLQNQVLRRVEELTGGVVAPGARKMMVETVRELMPRPKGVKA